MRVVCGWCAQATAPERCTNCGRPPALPWEQRGQVAPVVDEPVAGRPSLDRDATRRRLVEATERLTERGRPVTVDALAEQLGVDPRTVRRWRAL